MGEDAVQHDAVRQVPRDIGMERPAEADVHVGVAQQQVAFDQQFLLGAFADVEGEEFRRLAQEIIAGVDGIEGDVGGNDQGRLQRRGDQRLSVGQSEGLDPAVHPGHVTGFVHRQDALLENFQDHRQGRGAVAVRRRRPLGWQQARQRSRGDLPVLDHRAFRENDHLAAAQDFGGEKSQEARVIAGNTPQIPQQFGEPPVAFEQFVRRHAAAILAGGLMNEILRNDGLETGEMIEQENLALVDEATAVMDGNVDAETLAQ